MLYLMTTQRNAMIPTAGSNLEVSIPTLRALVVKRFTSEETGEFYAPVSTTATVAVKAENTEQSVAKTMRPARRRQAV